MTYDLCVIGGGIVGLATAYTLLQRQPGARLVLLEKEPGLARHQTGRNSGVIHAGVYYAPGSLKARLCRAGCDATKAFADAHGVPWRLTGKLIVATNDTELTRMETLHARAVQNDLTIDVLDAPALRRLEPQINGLGALLVQETGIVDYKAICDRLAGLIRDMGGEIRLGAQVTRLEEGASGVTITHGAQSLTAARVVVCGGLQADRLARMAGLDPDFRIIPFRGEYYRLPPHLNGIVNHLIYPVPDPDLPFLGVHLTMMIDGSITVGPNAVLGLAREGYGRADLSLRDVADMASFGGFWRLARRQIRTGAREMRDSLWKRGYLNQCRKYAPGLQLADLGPYPTGIRAQAVLRDGTMVQDFLFQSTERMLFVCNAPSPAATSALPISEMIADRMGL
jgi:L-2-hydroxyglutarate oxidase